MLRGIIFHITLFLFFHAKADAPELVIQSGHAEQVKAIAFSDDGRILATGSYDNTIKLWDVATGLEIRTLAGHTDGVSALAFAPSGLLASGGYDNTIKLWNIETGELLKTLNAHHYYVNSLAFSTDGRYFASTGKDFVLNLWDLQQQDVQSYQHSTDLTSVGFSEEGHVLYFGSYDNKIRYKDLDKDNALENFVTLGDQENDIAAVKMSADGKYFAAGNIGGWEEPGKAFVWDIEKKKLKCELGDFPKTLDVWHSAIDITPDNKYVLVLGNDERTITFYDLESGKPEKTIAAPEKTNVLAVSPDGKLLATAGSGDIRLYNIATTELVRSFESEVLTILDLQIRPENKLLLKTKTSLLQWNLKSGLVETLDHWDNDRQPVYSPNGKYKAYSQENEVVLYNIEQGNKEKVFPGGEDYVSAISFSNNGRYLAFASKDIVVYDILTSEKVAVLTGHTGLVLSLAFSPEDHFLASMGAVLDRTLKIWDFKKGRLIHDWDAKGNDIGPIAFSPDGRYIANGGRLDVDVPGIINVWDLQQGDLFQRFQNPPLFNAPNFSRSVNCLAFDPYSQKLAVGSSDNIVRVWDLESGSSIELTGHRSEINAVVFSADGKQLYSASQDGAIKIWDISTNKELCTLFSLNQNNWAVTSKDGLFDATDKAMRSMHYSIGLETIGLQQLKERYYEPKLLQKLLGFDDEPVRDVEAFREVGLFPAVDLSLEGKTLTALFTQRSGGMGPIGFYINGKEIISDARNLLKEGEEHFVLKIDLTKYNEYFIPQQSNSLGIQVYNREGFLSSRMHTVEYRFEAPGQQLSLFKNPRLFAIIIGTSDYRGEKLDLKYADKDARDIASAIGQSATQLLGKENVQVRVFTTDQASGQLPSKSNIKSAFEEFGQKATAADIVVLFLSGHGVTYGGQDGMFYYLTKDVESGDLNDARVREQYAISTSELTEWLKMIPAQKQVMILDACASGQLVEDILAETKSVSSSQIRAIERLKDRTGTFIIAGSASDMVSYEATQYGQSLLTYSLLLGMSGAALREGEYVDVGTLFQYATDQVPVFARNIGGIQRPVVSAPYGLNSFDIGKVTNDVHIPVGQVKPLFLRSSFLNQETLDDGLGLADLLDSRFRNISAKGREAPLIFIDTKNFPNAYYINGLYTVLDGQVDLKAKLYEIGEDRKKRSLGNLDITGPEEDPQVIIENILAEVQGLIK